MLKAELEARRKLLKATAKGDERRKVKRDVFAELTEGMTALADRRAGKRTLRTHTIEIKTCPEDDPEGADSRA